MHTGPRTRHRLAHQRQVLRAYYDTRPAPLERPEPMRRRTAVLLGLLLTLGTLSSIIWCHSISVCP